MHVAGEKIRPLHSEEFDMGSRNAVFGLPLRDRGWLDFAELRHRAGAAEFLNDLFYVLIHGWDFKLASLWIATC
jgi:hypothetical protein